ncbi:MAG: hypothetical protein QM760_18845 [Nibricoccus sp.]
MKTALFPSLLVSLAFGSVSLAGDSDKKTIVPTTSDQPQPWSFALSLPAWIPWQTGEAGINGITAHLKLGPQRYHPEARHDRRRAWRGAQGAVWDYGRV